MNKADQDRMASLVVGVGAGFGLTLLSKIAGGVLFAAVFALFLVASMRRGASDAGPSESS